MTDQRVSPGFFTNALNDRGQVVGEAIFNGGSNKSSGFIWQGGKFTQLFPINATPGSARSSALDINDHGDVVGFAYDNGNVSVFHPVEWSGGTQVPTDLGGFQDPSQCSRRNGVAESINNAGVISGYSSHGDCRSRSLDAFLLPPGGSMEDIAGGGCCNAPQGGDINRKGQVLIYTNTPSQPLPLERWDQGQVTQIPFSATTIGHDRMNDSGVVVGSLNGRAVYSHGTDVNVLPLPAGFTSSEAISINEQGDIVGYSSGPKGLIATLWPKAVVPQGSETTTKPIDLQSRIPPSSGVTLSEAILINNKGQIVASGRGGQGGEDVFLDPSNQRSHLRLSITFPDSHTGSTPSPNPGDVITVAVTVSSGNGVGDLSNLIFDGAGPLRISPKGAFSVESGPSPPVSGPFTLAPNTERTFTYRLKAVKLGLTELASGISGKDAHGAPVSATGRASLKVGLDLKVTMSYTPKALKIRLDQKDNPIPQPFSVKVTVTNPLSRTLHGVRLDKNPILELMGADIARPMRQDKGKPQPTLLLGTLAAGQSKSATFPFLATADGRGRVTWIATALNPNTPNSTIRGSGSLVVSIDPTVILRLDLNLRGLGGGRLLKSGDSATIGGVITNISNAQVVKLDPINPEKTGNASLGNPIDPDNPPPSDAYPLPIAPTLGPAEVQAFIADVQTVVSGGTRATISYKLKGKVERADGSKRDLKSSEVLSDPKDGTETIHIDDRVPPPATKADLYANVAMFSVGLAEGELQWLTSTFDTCAWLLETAPSTFVKAEFAPIELLQTVDYVVTYWHYLSPQERDQWLTQVAVGILAQTTEFGKNLAQVKAKVEQDVSAWIQNLSVAWDRGDWPTVAHLLGQVAGNVILEAATWVIKLPEAAKLIKLGDALKDSGVAKRVSEGLKALQAGDDLTKAGQAMSRLYGLTVRQIEALKLLAKEKGLLIALRPRNPLSIEWERLGALAKPELIKIKNVDEIDAAFLRYRKVDEGSVVFKRPITPEQLHNSMAYNRASTNLKKAADARLAARQTEWDKFEAQYRQMARPVNQGGGIDVSFDYTANGSAVPPSTTVATKRPFALDPVHGNGPDYYLVKMGDNRNILRRITGDVDMVAITKANGGVLSPEERLDIYLNLEGTVGIQHGDTLSWLDKGELLSDAKTSLLRDHVRGGEPLLVFDPSGAARANFIEPNYTFFNAADGQGRIWYAGGYRTPRATLYHFGQLSYPMFSGAYATASPWLTPAGWARQISQPPPPKSPLGTSVRAHQAPPSNSLLGGKCTWRYSSDSRAGLVYPDGKGGLRQWKLGADWRPLNLSSCWYHTKPTAGSPLGGDHVLRLLPQTSLQQDTTTGVRTIVINGINDVDPGLPASTTPWFSPKQQIVIDPGASVQEIDIIKTAVLTPHRSVLTLKSSLRHSHIGGTMISLVPRM